MDSASYPPAVIQAGYFVPPAPPSHPYAANSYLSAPSGYTSKVSNVHAPFTSTPYSQTTLYEDVPTDSLNSLQLALDEVKHLSRMTDPLSVVASVVAVASAAVKVSQTLYKVAAALGGANSEVESIASEVELFSDVLEDLREIIEEAEDIITPKALKHANSLLLKCQDVFETIQQMLAPYKDTDRISFWQSIQWAFRRERVNPVRYRLEALKSTLVVWLGTVRLAQYRSSSSAIDSSSDRKDKKYLLDVEKSIVRNSSAIVRWQRAEAEASQSYNPYGQAYPAIAYTPTTPSKEIQWMSHLVPYTNDSKSGPQNQALQLGAVQLSPSIPRSISNIEVLKTVNVLLAKWTTLDVSAEDLSESRTATGKTGRSKRDVEKATGTRRPALARRLGRDAESSGIKKTKANKEQPREMLRTKKTQPLSVKGIDNGNRESKAEDDASTQTDGVAESIRKERVGDNATDTDDVQAFDSIIADASGDEASDDNVRVVISNGPPSDISSPKYAPSSASYVYPPVSQPYPQAGHTETIASHRQAYTAGPQIEYAQKVTSDSHPPDHTVPYGLVPQAQAPIPTSSWGNSYQIPSPYSMPMFGPPPPKAPPPSKTLNGKEIMARVQEMLLKNKEENISREKAGLAQIAAANAAREKTYRKEMEAAVLRANMNAERVIAESIARVQKEAEIKEFDMEHGVIHFKDAVGRRFIFPFKRCRTWRDMQTLVCQSFFHVETLKPYVVDGQYDLLDSDGAIILPQVWDSVIEPGQTIEMHLWSLPGQDSTQDESASTASAPSTAPGTDLGVLQYLDGTPSPSPKPPNLNPLSESAFLHPPEAPQPPPAIAEEDSEAQSTPTRKRSKDRPRTLGTSGESSSDESTKSEYAGGSEVDGAESSVVPWQEALHRSFEKHAEEFQRTWDTITEAAKAEAEREILRKWLKESSGSKDQEEDHQIQTQAKDLIEQPKNTDRPAIQQLQMQLPASVSGSPSANPYATEAPRSLLALGSRTESKHDVASALETSPLSAGPSWLCSECRSPLSRGKQTEDPLPDIGSDQTPQSPPRKPTMAQGVVPQLSSDMSPPPNINKSIAERLDLVEKILQYQGNVQGQAKEEEKERLAPLEKTVQKPGNGYAPAPALMTPPITEPELSQSYTLSSAKTPSKNGTVSTKERKGPSLRSSFRARLFGRAKSDSGAVH
ncbi:hypothetical protein GJ744_010700 [Endocarpon pusillum]|uniref:Fungal N-terminal domain-containing protein n=1 Tax=Endocarpon pusillum TaxID=364733 RepID=A0A8H7AED0_9EURO|nr:hypothetical protein GJ744_010700 [Endocarpon pusillum]